MIVQKPKGFERELSSFDFAHGRLTGTWVNVSFKIHLLAFGKAGHTVTFKGCRMDENVLATVFRLDKAETLGFVVKFYGT